MCLSADLGAETYGLTRSKELGARSRILFRFMRDWFSCLAVSRWFWSCNHWSAHFAFYIALTFFSTDMELKMVGILLEQSLLISRFVSSTLHDVFFYSADWDVFVCRFWCGICWIDRFERLGARTRIHAASCGIYFTRQRFCCFIITLIAGNRKFST